MKLTEKEKEFFEIENSDLTDKNFYKVMDQALDHIIYIYTKDAYNETIITYNFIKRMILEYAKKMNYIIDEEETYDSDKLLSKIIELDEKLADFDVTYYQKPQELNSYFYELTKNSSYEKTYEISSAFRHTNDSFRVFFIAWVKKFQDLIRELSFKLAPIEEDNLIESNNGDDIPTITINEDDNIDWIDDFDIFGKPCDDRTSLNEEKDILSENELRECIKFINILPNLIKYRNLGTETCDKLHDLANQKKLAAFYSNEDFSSKFDIIMEHDKSKSAYYFHGTTCISDAESILEKGLGMMREDITATAYKEFTKDQVILYERGLSGEIGRDAIVIIDVPKDENGKNINIVRENNDKDNFPFSPSGLQGLDGKSNYIVPTEYIVGYVDKQNIKIIFNPKYKDYNKYTTNNNKHK